MTLQPCVLESAVKRQNAPPGGKISPGGDGNALPVAVMGSTRTSGAVVSASDGQAPPQVLNEIAMTRAEMFANIAETKNYLLDASVLMSCSSKNSQLGMADLMNLVTQISSKLDSIVPSPHPDACHTVTLSNTTNALMAILWSS